MNSRAKEDRGFWKKCPGEEDLVAFAMGETDCVYRDAIRRHIGLCRPCSRLVDGYSRTVETLKKEEEVALLDRDQLSEAVADNSEEKLPERKRAQSRLFGYMPGFKSLLRVAAVLAILLGVTAVALKFRSRNTAVSASQSIGTALHGGVDWLLAKQRPDGGWESEDLGGDPRYAPALNGLAMLALRRSDGIGEDLSERLEKATEHLLQQQSSEGRFGPVFDRTLYNQGIATLALLEIYEKTGDGALREPISRSLDYILAQQSYTGGWGYGGAQTSNPNTSVTAWQVQALLRADKLGWNSDRGSIRKALRWMTRTMDSKGHFGYQAVADSSPGNRETFTMMGAHCILTAQDLDIPIEPELEERLLQGVRDVAGKEPKDYYGAYFYASTLSEMGEEAFGRALASLKSSLVERQSPLGGGWSADDRWGSAGGTIYSTSMSLLALQPVE